MPQNYGSDGVSHKRFSWSMYHFFQEKSSFNSRESLIPSAYPITKKKGTGGNIKLIHSSLKSKHRPLEMLD